MVISTAHFEILYVTAPLFRDYLLRSANSKQALFLLSLAA